MISARLEPLSAATDASTSDGETEEGGAGGQDAVIEAVA
jgi:hypothetical protein